MLKKQTAYFPTLTAEEIAAATDFADELIDGILPIISEAVAAATVDGNAVNFSLWTFFTRLLAERGWAPDQLARDAAFHAAHQTSEGSVQ